MTDEINLNELIAPPYYDMHWDIIEGKHTYYDCYGGRGSLKSSDISLEIVLGLKRDAQNGITTNAAIFRKTANTLRDSVYEQIGWAIEELGLDEEWRAMASPLKYVNDSTGQQIIFRGLDKAKKIKSIKVKRGYIKYLWFEELDEFSGAEEIRSVQQSVLRGGEHFVVFKSFNPPISQVNWANEYVREPDERSYRLETNYLQAPPEWLGAEFIAAAEHLKAVNPKAYEHEYLGKPVGTGTNVFEFLELREITNEEIETFDRIYQGVDWGYYPDPYAFVRCYYDHARETIYLIDEIVGNRWSNRKTADEIISRGYDDYQMTCDTSENKSIDDYRDFGLIARGAIKGPGSVEYSTKWLQTKTIVIDKQRTPRAYKEFTEYEFDVDANGNVISAYPDRNNHTIDAVRYAFNPLYVRRGNSA